MQFLNVSEFFSGNIPPLILGGFFSRRMFSHDNKYIFIYTAYKKSQKIKTEEIDFNNYDRHYINALNEESNPYPYWTTKETVLENTNMSRGELSGQAFFVLKNDLNISSESFYNKLYAKIVSTCEWIFEEKLN